MHRCGKVTKIFPRPRGSPEFPGVFAEALVDKPVETGEKFQLSTRWGTVFFKIMSTRQPRSEALRFFVKSAENSLHVEAVFFCNSPLLTSTARGSVV